MLREYDTVTKEQLQRSIVEIVERPFDGEVGKVHDIASCSNKKK